MALCLPTAGLADTPSTVQDMAVQEPDIASRLPVRLFSHACVATLAEPARLEELMAQVGEPLDQPGSFLQGYPGKVWTVGDSHQQTHAVARQDRGVCMVYLAQGNAQAIEDEFGQLGMQASPPLQVIAQQSTSNDGRLRYLRYTWHASGQPSAILLTLTLDLAPQASLRGMLSANYTEPPVLGEP